MKKNKIGILFIILGILFISYPFIGRIINTKNQTTAILNYQKEVGKLSEDELDEQKKLAQEYNSQLFETNIVDENTEEKSNENSKIDYLKVINLNNMIGYIKIPKINVNLPIYHSSNSKILEVGVGHMEHTSLPVGGKSTHSVLTAHSGMVRQAMFDRLEELEIGDKFYIYVLNDELTYQVDQIKIVEPNDERYTQIEQEKDYVTLVTCTPYGINTHRILVRGTRIENESNENVENVVINKNETTEEKEQVKDDKKIKNISNAIIVVILCFIILILLNRRKNEK